MPVLIGRGPLGHDVDVAGLEPQFWLSPYPNHGRT
jgi:hypothetical protein